MDIKNEQPRDERVSVKTLWAAIGSFLVIVGISVTIGTCAYHDRFGVEKSSNRLEVAAAENTARTVTLLEAISSRMDGMERILGQQQILLKELTEASAKGLVRDQKIHANTQAIVDHENRLRVVENQGR